jgi:hypothetical protein
MLFSKSFKISEMELRAFMAHNSSELVPYLKEVITKERAVFETVMDLDDEEEDYEPENYAVANATRILLEFRNPDIVNFLFENVFDDEDFSIVSMQYNDYFHFTVLYMMSFEFDTFRENVLAMSFENSNLTICQDVLTCLGHFHPEIKEKSEKLITELFELYRKEATAIPRSEEKRAAIEQLSYLCWSIADMRLTQFKETIKTAYADELVDEEVVGSYDEIIEQIHLSGPSGLMFETISKHENITMDYMHALIEEETPEEFTEEMLSRPDDIFKIVGTKKEPKVERNDPCPCGSGKKYKKCCGA